MIDLESVKARVKRDHPAIDVDAVEAQYREFLRIGAGQPPSEAVDRFWHAHILDTKKYAQDCHHLFGRFLHHMPTGDYCMGTTRE